VVLSTVHCQYLDANFEIGPNVIVGANEHFFKKVNDDYWGKVLGVVEDHNLER